MDSRLLSLIESVIASLGILLLSAFTVPFVGGMVGVSITTTQGFGMGVVFFFGRVVLLYVIRRIFNRCRS